MKTVLTGILLSCTLLLFGRNTRTISVNVSIEPTQRLTLLSSTEFPELAANHLDLGYNQLESCVELEIKSNVPWVLIAYNDSFSEQTENNYKVRISGNPYVALTQSEVLLMKSNAPTNSEIINIDCKRLVNWDSTKPGSWEFSPLFKLLPLTEDWINY
jgi:hypothetical protein